MASPTTLVHTEPGRVCIFKIPKDVGKMARGTIRYLVDEKGRKQSVLLPISKNRELLEDLSDLAAIAKRKDEPAEALDDLRKGLQEKWQSTE